MGSGAASEACGVNFAGSSVKPGVRAAAARSAALTHGAPSRRKGVSVPRPSETLVADNNATPG
jgi:hypothetical protein